MSTNAGEIDARSEVLKENTLETEASRKADRQPGPEPGPEVHITINGESKPIHRGRRAVVEIKTLGGVPLADELEQLIDGKLKPLPDDCAVTIKGAEVFMSHVRSGGSA
jgi:hypothetical protein